MVQSYFDEMARILSMHSSEIIDQIVEKVNETFLNGGRLFVCGNGGSAAISMHLVTDLMKISIDTDTRVFAHALGTNPALMTMISNDYGFENSFSLELKACGREGDALLTISSSGNSLNILNAVKHATDFGIDTICLVGFDGGSLSRSCKICLHVETPLGQYALVEDMHSMICHEIASRFRRALESK